ncbi:LLM class flavin-dependent oxidoreductase [Amycolatopsis sp. YIM 10]|uniref:LLM class flavin-dependent oxidoreductase n=1 Tax=Amycolatopsis sp. YIM 10 TaxID=2653857 RepID=UPI0012902507|nr:LLM class flavin-dependent oxidoreductase [Amycolatopsis sp. YIM 10]QFU91045.1 Limonene 1,2-monooxygenase [Amycolatopsis sp. YIM 10]
MTSLRFGAFLPPIHPLGENPTWWLRHDLDLMAHLDRLGFDEAWIGEHHSTGRDIIASPEIFIAAAAERTTRIRLGTGMTTLPYHHPLWVADRMVMLDHLTRGRVMFGVGPGSLPADAAMIGMTPTESRELLETHLDVIQRLLAGESVTTTVGSHKLVDATLQLRPFTEPCFEIAVAATASPTGARLAGSRGVSLISLGATMTQDGFDALAYHWGIATERAANAGRPAPDRATWRLVTEVHVAETREQAYRDVEFGLRDWIEHLRENAAVPGLVLPDGSTRELIEFVNESGLGAIGTADDVRRQIQRMVDQSGGFGTVLLLAHDWADPTAAWRSWELVARQVAPHFQGPGRTHVQSRRDARARILARREEATIAAGAALEHMNRKYADEVAGA